MKPATHLAHQPQQHSAHDNPPYLQPIYQSVCFTMPNMSEWQRYLSRERTGFSYLTDGNPTVRALEEVLAQMQGQEAAMVTSTGKSAIAALLLSQLASGDHVILLQEGYKSTRFFVRDILSKFGVELTIVRIDDLDRLEEFVRPKKTKLLMLEAPTNPMTRVPDFEPVLEVCRKHDIVSVLDNSLGGLHNHGQFPFTYFVHSLSKYTTGVGDCMGGAVLGSSEDIAAVRRSTIWNIDTMDPSVAARMLNGLHTYPLRLERQSQNAMDIANALAAHPQVTRMLYPGHPTHPDYANAKKQMKSFGTIVSFDVEGDTEQMLKVVDGVKLFKVSFGAGFTQSIISPTWLFYARTFDDEQVGAGAIRSTTIRLSIGTEDPDDLIADLTQALDEL